jgi:hypothetical protein
VKLLRIQRCCSTRARPSTLPPASQLTEYPKCQIKDRCGGLFGIEDSRIGLLFGCGLYQRLLLLAATSGAASRVLLGLRFGLVGRGFLIRELFLGVLIGLRGGQIGGHGA